MSEGTEVTEGTETLTNGGTEATETKRRRKCSVLARAAEAGLE